MKIITFLKYALKNFFVRDILSIKNLLLIITLFASVYMIFNPFSARLVNEKLKMGALEMLPFFLFDGTNRMLFYGVFVALILKYPENSGYTNEISRLGKLRWLKTQYIYIILSAVLYVMLWTAGFIIAFHDSITWTDRWSSFTAFYLENGNSLKSYEMMPNIGLVISKGVIKKFNPLEVYFITVLFSILGSTFTGITTVLFNIIYKRGTGTVLGFFLACETGIIDGILDMFDTYFFTKKYMFIIYYFFKNLLHYLSPLYQCDLVTMYNYNGWSFFTNCTVSAFYFALLFTVLHCVRKHMFKKIDILQ